MKFSETELPGVYLVELEPKSDHRGFFARAWCQMEFEARGLAKGISQCNIGFSERAGTLRGIHYQKDPYGEAKLVRCTRGALHDVVVDVRASSPTYGKWIAHRLSAQNRLMLFLPKGVGHGYQTLEDGTEIFYQASEPYHPESATGIRYDDPSLAISWPLPVAAISDGDLSWSDFPLETADNSDPRQGGNR